VERVQDIAFFTVLLVYVWAGIDTRLIYHWQGPVFSTMPGFVNDFLKYPGGPADYVYSLIAQAYVLRGWGAIVLTAQVAAVTALTHAYFKALAGRALPLVRFVPAILLLYHLNLYYDRTPIVLALMVGLAPAILFVRLSSRWRSEAALLGAFAAMLPAVYYLGGMAIVFFAPAAAIVQLARRPRRPVGIAYLLLAAALPAAVERLRFTYIPTSARNWFVDADARRVVACWALYVFYAALTLLLVGRPFRAAAPRKRRIRLLATPALLLLLAAVAAFSYQSNSRDRRMSAVDYYSSHENWQAVLDASRSLAAADFNSLVRYEVNLSLYQMNRLGDDMFRFPQTGAMLLDFHDDRFLPYMLRLTDLCLRLGRVNEAEHYGSEAMVLARSDPRVYRLMAEVNLVKGQTAAARKFFNVLSYDLVSGPWARQRLRELDRGVPFGGDRQVPILRARMLRNDDMISVWQRADKPNADMERLLQDQLEQDPSNRMAFEFLMGNYLLLRDMVAIDALMPRIKDMSGPAYIGPDGRRRTPRHYQEAMAIYADVTGKTPEMEGLEIQPETLERMAAFKKIIRETSTREAAMEVSREAFRDTYFFYFAFGPGAYR